MQNKNMRPLKTFAGWVLATLLLVLAVQPALAQSNGQDERLVNYSLYYELFKNQDYENALPYLRWMLDHAPAYAPTPDGTGRVTSVNFERAIILYDSLAQAATGAERRAHLDTVLALYDRMVPTVKQAGGEIDEVALLIEQGRYIQRREADLPDLQDRVAALYMKAYELDPSKVDDYTVQYVIANTVQAGDKAAALALMDKVEANRGDNAEMMAYLDQVRDSLFRTPEERMTFLEEQLAKKPDDAEIINELFDIYRRVGEKEKMVQIAQRLLQMEPSERVLRALMTYYQQEGDMDKVSQLFDELKKIPGADIKPQDYYNLAVAQQQKGQLTAAKASYEKALDLDSSFGEARLGILHVYAQAVQRCGGGDGSVYWLLYDMFSRAGASGTAAGYRRAFPDAEAIFYNDNWEEGKTINVRYECSGIAFSGSTTVRKR